ncbi:MAG: NTP transferase domain-containing protein, partial [Anaerolineaceae bacterium]|nr:NTP transferase domain-containing protein [Anaerolineaceae bacterium]
MKSKLPKVLHQVVGKPMVWYALRSAANLSSQKPVVVVGNGAEQVREALGEDAAEYVLQTERLGTGHAVKQAEQTLRGKGDLVLVINGDLPLLREETLERLVALQRDGGGVFSMATVESDHPRGFGRVVLAADGTVSAIVEEADCTPAQREIRVLNVGVYCFSAEWLWGALRQLELSPKGEYYLTDLVKIAAAEGNKVLGLPVDDANEAAGVNTRVHLAEVEALMRERINTGWMLEGVTMTHPAQTYIEPTVKIGADTVIHPNCWLRGSTTIGEDCEIGPNTIITDSSVGNRTKILSSVLEMAVVENDV